MSKSVHEMAIEFNREVENYVERARMSGQTSYSIHKTAIFLLEMHFSSTIYAQNEAQAVDILDRLDAELQKLSRNEVKLEWTKQKGRRYYSKLTNDNTVTVILKEE